jgi:hypothetical protein
MGGGVTSIGLSVFAEVCFFEAGFSFGVFLFGVFLEFFGIFPPIAGTINLNDDTIRVCLIKIEIIIMEVRQIKITYFAVKPISTLRISWSQLNADLLNRVTSFEERFQLAEQVDLMFSLEDPSSLSTGLLRRTSLLFQKG